MIQGPENGDDVLRAFNVTGHVTGRGAWGMSETRKWEPCHHFNGHTSMEQGAITTANKLEQKNLIKPCLEVLAFGHSSSS